MCTHALMSPWTKVSLDIKCPWTILDKSLLGQMSPWTIVSLDKSLLGQKSPWTKVSLDKSPLDKHPLDKSLLGQKSSWTKVPSDKSLLGQSPLGQLSQHLASLRHTTHICEQRIDLCLLPDLAQFGKVFAKSRQKMSETKPGSSKSSILSYASCMPNA